ncbi:MAG: protein phosphatase 2C domain-containing protein [Candidatus Symbiothrix sp.]|jgi:serine/threonine protein phosphatase PrpC|nr:protein phosphatase 2C domain-containing protein [Candidatus Symbiothrix sp.]
MEDFLKSMFGDAANPQQIADFKEQYGNTIKEDIQKHWEVFNRQNAELQNPDDKQADENTPTEPTAISIETVVEATEQKENINEKIDNKMKLGTGLPNEAAREKARNDALEAQIKGQYIAFPNGKINQEYIVTCDFATQLPEISNIQFEGLEQIGLQYDAETKQITGKPTVAGDHKITMQCKYKGWENGEGRPEYIPKEVTIIIIPDPRSLWKNIPTPPEVEYYKPDEDKAFVKIESKTTTKFLGLKHEKEARKDMVAASQRGRSHAHEGKARDDDFALYFDNASEWYVMVVADGAGSAKYSRKGSAIACKTVIEVCKAKLVEFGATLEKHVEAYNKSASNEVRKQAGDLLYNIIGTAVFQAYKNIETEATHGPSGKLIPLKEYATTLLLSICKKFEFGWFVGAFWVGDGGMGIYRKEEPVYLKILGEPDGGEFAGQTRFLTMPEIMQPTEIYRRLRFDIVPDFSALILMTDGVTDPKFETDANLNRIEKWHALWDDLNGNNEDKVKVDFSDDNEHSAGQLLEWLDFWSKGNHDDRTIAILF